MENEDVGSSISSDLPLQDPNGGGKMISFNGPKRAQTILQSTSIIDDFVDRFYSAEHFLAVATCALNLIESKLKLAKDANSEEVHYNSSHRAKRHQSLREKLKVRNEKCAYHDPSDILEDVKDLAGVRITLVNPNKAQRRKVQDIIKEIWGDQVEWVSHGDPRRARASAPSSKTEERDADWITLEDAEDYAPKHNGYQADHYRARMLKSQEGPSGGSYTWRSYDRVEIQVVSRLSQAWADAGHDIVYKTHAYGPPTTEELRILDAINGLVISGDLLFEQFFESVTKRTLAKWTHHAQLAVFLRESDVLKMKGKHGDADVQKCFQSHFATQGVKILFRFLEKTDQNYPLAVRNALMHFGYPDDPAACLHEEIAKYNFLDTPPEGLLAPFCLISHLLPEGIVIPQGSSIEEKCALMMDAFILLQTFVGSAIKAKALIRVLSMTQAEEASLSWVLHSPYREDCLIKKDGEVKPEVAQKLQPAWHWFEREVEEDGLCGLFLKMAVLGAPAKELNYVERMGKLKIKSLSRTNTEDSDMGETF